MASTRKRTICMSVTQPKRHALCRTLQPCPAPPSMILTLWCHLTVQSKVIGLYCTSLVGTLCRGGMPVQHSLGRLYGVWKRNAPAKTIEGGIAREKLFTIRIY